MAVSETIAELKAALADVQKRSLRLLALLRLADHPDTIEALKSRMEFLAQRDLRLSTTIAALEALVEHGHPVIGKLGLTEEQCADLAIDRDLILDGFAGDIRCEIVGADTVSAVVSDEIPIP